MWATYNFQSSNASDIAVILVVQVDWLEKARLKSAIVKCVQLNVEAFSLKTQLLLTPIRESWKKNPKIGN